MLRKAISVLLLSGVLAQAGNADTLLIEGIVPDDGVSQPARGLSKDEVAADYGEPVTRNPAVGDPPISNWVYDGFIVYFEYDTVLHAVARR